MPNDVLVIPPLKRVGESLVKGTVRSVKEAKILIREMAFSTERFAKQLTPVDTGRLRGSITVGFPVATKGIKAEVFTNVQYAPYVHFGTSRMRGRPFMTEGKDLMLRKFTGEKIADRLDKQYRREFIKL